MEMTTAVSGMIVIVYRSVAGSVVVVVVIASCVWRVTCDVVHQFQEDRENKERETAGK